MGTRQGGRPAKDGRRRPAAQDRAEAPRMAQVGVSERPEPSGTLAGRDGLLGQAWKPERLSWEPREPNDTAIDDLGRHLAARVRLSGYVRELCAKQRWAFKAVSYAATTKDSHRRVAALLVEYGGLPQGTEYLNAVPAAVLEVAVEQFATYFGLQAGESGKLAGTGFGPSELAPTPRFRVTEDAPW